MEFTQINEIASFLKLPFQQILAENILNYATSLPQFKKQFQLNHQTDYLQLLKNLDELNAYKANQTLSVNNQSNQFDNISQKQTQQNALDPDSSEFYLKLDRSKSTMFKNSLLNSKSFSDTNQSHKNIQIFYFNKPISKVISYSNKTTIKQLIQKALEQYLLQNYDAIKANQPVQRFQIRLPVSEENYLADLDIEPIHYDRILSENLFETLVLVQKPKKQDNFHSKPTKQYSLQDSTSSWSHQLKDDITSTQTIMITLKDQTYFQLMRIQVQIDGTLEKVFKIIQENNLIKFKKFILKQDPDSQYDLTPDQQVKFLQTTKLYVMTKKYMDQSQQDNELRPIRLKTLINKQLNFLPPIGINQASKYEQFLVTKISSMGIAVDRVLGIDQTKLYNYGKQMRQNNNKLSLLDKFLGMDKQSGTKKPYRYIKQIKEIRKFCGGFQLVYKEKTTTYFVKDQTALDKIVRKLSFLVKKNHPESPVKKKTLQFDVSINS